MLRYISHPEIVVEPAVAVPDWRLSDTGRRRAVVMLDQPWVERVTRIVASGERKAIETAEILAGRLGIDIEVRIETGEIDRSATGFVPHDEHEALADQCFAEPERSVAGWERAIDAQRRVAVALSDMFVEPTGAAGDCAVIGHGGVGTLLMCQVGGLSINRDHDQPGGGHHWCFDRTSQQIVHRWRPIDVIA